MKYSLLMAAGTAMLFTAASCKKNDHTNAVPSATIEIAAPFTNQEYQSGDTVAILGTITGTVTLHGYSMVIVDRQSGDSVFMASSHEHAMKLDVKQQWVNGLSNAAHFRLYVSTAINHDGLQTIKTVDFTVGSN
jgi:hypothetical protein